MTRNYSYKYPRAALTVDCVVFGFDGDQLLLLLIKRKENPFKGKWALPGGFAQVDETLERAAARELSEETGLNNLFLEQLYTFSAIDRDPRERVISVAYFALVKPQSLTPDSDASAAEWFALDELPKLAFDHENIISVAKARLQGKIRYQPIGFELLPARFTLTQLQRLYEAVLDRELDKRNFRKKILGTELLWPLDEFESGVPNRAARLYRFDSKRYQKLQCDGYLFEV